MFYHYLCDHKKCVFMNFKYSLIVLSRRLFYVSKYMWLYWCYSVSILLSGVGFNQGSAIRVVQDSELVWQRVEPLWLPDVRFLFYLGHSAAFPVWGGLYLGPHAVQPDTGNVLFPLIAILRCRSEYWAKSHYDLQNGKVLQC